MEYYIKSFQDFIRSQCVLHVDIKHDDQQNVAFIRYQSFDDLGQIQNHASPILVIVARYYGRANGQTADDMKMKQFVQLRFVCAAVQDAVMNYSDIITAAADKSFQVMMDFISLMKQLQHDENCGPLRGIELENANWSEIPEQPYLVNYYGWDLTLPFNSEFPDHDSTRWMVPLQFSDPAQDFPLLLKAPGTSSGVGRVDSPDAMIEAWNEDPQCSAVGTLVSGSGQGGAWLFLLQMAAGQPVPAFIEVGPPGRIG